MNRFIPVPLDWTTHPDCVTLREENTAYPNRWLHLIHKAHHINSGGALAHYNGRPHDAKSLSWDHDRDVEGWERFLDFCLAQNLLELKEQTLKVASDVWKDWYRSPSQYPEVERHRKSADRKQKELEQVLLDNAKLRKEHEKLRKSLRSRGDPNQLKLETTSDERTDRLADNQKAEDDPDSSPASEEEDRADRVPSCPEASGAVRSRPDNRTTCKNTCISRDITNKPPEREEPDLIEQAQAIGSVGSVTLDKDVFWNSDDPRSLKFWSGVRELHRKLKGGKEDGDWRKVFLKHLEPACREVDKPDPEFWLRVMRFSINETHARIRDPLVKEKPRRPWGYAASLLKEYAPVIADRIRRGLPVHGFVRLNVLKDQKVACG